MSCSPITEGATNYFFNSDSQLPVLHSRADGVGSPKLLPIHRFAQRHILALHKRKLFLQMVGYRKSNGHRITRDGFNARYRQFVKRMGRQNLVFKCKLFV